MYKKTNNMLKMKTKFNETECSAKENCFKLSQRKDANA